MGVPRVHPADTVQVLLRRDGGPPLDIRASREPPSFNDPVQWFRAQLPVMAPGREAEYRIEWRRAGRTMAQLPTDGSWLRLLGVDQQDVVATSPTIPVPGDQDWPSTPRFGRDLEFFAALTANLCPEAVGPTPEGYRINFYIEEGRVVGPCIDAVVEPRGGDWMCIRPDGVGVLNIKVVFRTQNDSLILEEAGGVIDLGPDGHAMVAAGRFAGTPPFYATPRWFTSDPDWAWLNRLQGFGFGRVVMSKLQAQCDIYLPRVGGEGAGD